MELPTPTNAIELVNDIAMKERERTKKKDQRKSISEYSISSNNDPQIIPSNDVQDPHVPIPTSDQSHDNPIGQIAQPTSSTNTNIRDDESTNNTNTNSNTNENQDDANIDYDITTKDKCPSPKTKDAPANDDNKINTIEDEVTDGQADHQYDTRSTRGQRPRQYSKVYGTDYTFAIALMQMSATRGI